MEEAWTKVEKQFQSMVKAVSRMEASHSALKEEYSSLVTDVSKSGQDPQLINTGTILSRGWSTMQQEKDHDTACGDFHDNALQVSEAIATNMQLALSASREEKAKAAAAKTNAGRRPEKKEGNRRF